MDAARTILRERFGHADFRPGQADAIARLLAGESAACVFPTGGGKSLVYQLPALCLAEEGLTLVVSPLIALMKDQVDALRARGIDFAAALDSTLTAEQSALVKDRLRRGEIRLLYVAPERFNNEGFVAMLQGLTVALFAVDEAHCISEWGQSFRPDYLKLPRFKNGCGAKRVLALTATATPKVASDICAAFGIDPEKGLFRTSSYRNNLDLRVTYHPTPDARSNHLLSLFRAPDSLTKAGGGTIVYVTLQKTAETVAAFLTKSGFKAEAYHAGMDADKRTQCQNWFMTTPNSIVVATIAFGMGIDHSAIRCVFHYNLPKSLESYSQEVGRAGRDGKPSMCELLLCSDDLATLESFAYGDTPSKSSVRRMLDSFFEGMVKSDGIDVGTGFSKKDGTLGEVQVGLFGLGRDVDMRDTVLKTMLAQLDISFGLVTEITPMYGQYEICAVQPGWEMRNESVGDPIWDTLRRFTFKKAKWSTVDVDGAAKAKPELGGRFRFISALQNLEDSRKIQIKASQVMNRYRIYKMPDDVDELAGTLYRMALDRETKEIDRLHKVISWATSPGCLATKLAAHFGDALPEGKDTCGHCSACATDGQGLDAPGMSEEAALGRLEIFDHTKWNKVLAEGSVPRDDARLLARFALGFTSPRMTALKLSKHPLFGSMDDHDFRVVLSYAEKECAKAAQDRKRGPDEAIGASNKKSKR